MAAPKKKPALEEKLDEKITEIKRLEEEQRAKELAAKLKLPYINLLTLPIQTDALMMLDEKDARAGKVAVIQRSDNKLKIALRDPQNPATQAALDGLTKQGFSLSLFITSPHSLTRAFDRYKGLEKQKKEISGRVEITEELLKKYQEELKGLGDIKKKVEGMSQDEPTHLLEMIIAGSLQNGASDLHFESKETGGLLRFRVDGILHDSAVFSIKTYNLILSRIKLLSSMVLNVRDKAQDGRFSIRIKDYDVEVRVSIIPGPYGENIVMRILDPKNISLSIKDLGFREDAYQFLLKEIDRPNGMIITTGPTGSGKTTALYAFLKEITSPDLKIITLEDPIEYHLTGVTQTQVESEQGYTFASGLRAILRQDPDVVLVGEIRDQETAETAIHAALTGHIVFSTLHTNDAAGAIPRFIDMGANPTILSAALIDVMAQRLLRRVCKECQEEYTPSAEEKEKIKKALEGLPKEVTLPDIGKDFKLVRGKGCAKCSKTGYKSRVGVYEIIHIDAAMEKIIAKSPSHAEVLEQAKQSGFVSMYQDGVIKILQGVTTFEELDNIVGDR